MSGVGQQCSLKVLQRFLWNNKDLYMCSHASWQPAVMFACYVPDLRLGCCDYLTFNVRCWLHGLICKNDIIVIKVVFFFLSKKLTKLSFMWDGLYRVNSVHHHRWLQLLMVNCKGGQLTLDWFKLSWCWNVILSSELSVVSLWHLMTTVLSSHQSFLRNSSWIFTSSK